MHVTGVWQPTSVSACRAAKRARIPYVVSPRGALGRYSFTQKPWKKWPFWWLHERRNCRCASGVHFTSEMERDECARFNLPGRGFVVPNSIDFSEWWRDADAGVRWRESIGAAGSTRVFLYAGRIHHKKGLDLLPEVAAGMKGLDFKIIILGRDEEGTVATLDAGFQKAGVRERVAFLPITDTAGLRAAYSGSDCFVLPSRHENFGNVVVEALACGCPAAVSTATGCSPAISGLAGVSILPRSAQPWTATLSAKPRTGGLSVRGELESRFSVAAVAAKMARCYESLL